MTFHIAPDSLDLAPDKSMETLPAQQLRSHLTEQLRSQLPAQPQSQLPVQPGGWPPRNRPSSVGSSSQQPMQAETRPWVETQQHSQLPVQPGGWLPRPGAASLAPSSQQQMLAENAPASALPAGDPASWQPGSQTQAPTPNLAPQSMPPAAQAAHAASVPENGQLQPASRSGRQHASAAAVTGAHLQLVIVTSTTACTPALLALLEALPQQPEVSMTKLQRIYRWCKLSRLVMGGICNSASRLLGAVAQQGAAIVPVLGSTTLWCCCAHSRALCIQVGLSLACRSADGPKLPVIEASPATLHKPWSQHTCLHCTLWEDTRPLPQHMIVAAADLRCRCLTAHPASLCAILSMLVWQSSSCT